MIRFRRISVSSEAFIVTVSLCTVYLVVGGRVYFTRIRASSFRDGQRVPTSNIVL
jgi:hypothetical protein